MFNVWSLIVYFLYDENVPTSINQIQIESDRLFETIQ